MGFAFRSAHPYASFVMPGFMPGIHVLKRHSGQEVDGRDKPGHDAATYALRQK
jgi:hypothetical protein